MPRMSLRACVSPSGLTYILASLMPLAHPKLEDVPSNPVGYALVPQEILLGNLIGLSPVPCDIIRGLPALVAIHCNGARPILR